jgi:hypothetical protein
MDLLSGPAVDEEGVLVLVPTKNALHCYATSKNNYKSVRLIG